MNQEIFKNPLVRCGYICSAERNLKASETEKVDALVVDSEPTIMKALLNGLQQLGCKNVEKAYKDQRVEHPFPKLSILDFPTVNLQYKDYFMKCKSSVTVCRSDRQSKVWTRMSYFLKPDSDLTDLKVEEVEQFYEEANFLCEKTNDLMLNQYKSVLVSGKFINELETSSTFLIRATGSSDETVGKLLKDMHEKPGFTIAKALKEEDLARPLLAYFSLVFNQNMRSPLDVSKKVKENGYEWITGNSDKYDAFFSIHSEDEKTVIDGICYEEENYKGEPKAQIATRDILRAFARYY